MTADTWTEWGVLYTPSDSWVDTHACDTRSDARRIARHWRPKHPDIRVVRRTVTATPWEVAK